MNSLRQALREQTAIAHEKLDTQISKLELADSSDYQTFLLTHLWAIRVIEQERLSGGILEILSSCVQLLDQDFTTVSEKTPPENVLSSPALKLSDVSVSYVIGGSNFGKQILTKRWQATSDEKVLQAGQYLQSRGNRELWQIFCAEAEKVSDAEYPVFVQECDCIFNLFARSLELAKTA